MEDGMRSSTYLTTCGRSARIREPDNVRNAHILIVRIPVEEEGVCTGGGCEDVECIARAI
jgi:hypothetical protein